MKKGKGERGKRKRKRKRKIGKGKGVVNQYAGSRKPKSTFSLLFTSA